MMMDIDGRAASAARCDELMTALAAPAWIALAERCGGRLASLHAPTEAALLGLGDRLRQAHGTARNLAAMAHALNHRLAEAEFQRILGELDGTVRLVEELRDDRTDRGERLARLTEAATSIRQGLGGLLQTMTHVKVLGVNAKIEAAQMAGGSDDFSLFTHQIVRLSTSGRETVEKAVQELATLIAAADEGCRTQRAFDHTHLQQLGDVAGRLRTSLAAMRQRERAAAGALERLPAVLDEATGRIGAVVGGLQFGDIARQRLEHVETALAAVVATATGEQPLPAVDGASLPVFVAAVCDLQAEQLRQIRDEFGARLDAVLDDLKDLARLVADIGAQTASVHADGAEGGSTFLMAIDHELERVAVAVDSYVEARRCTEASLERVSRAAGRMGDWMKAIADVDEDMSLIGLNASIKCGNLGGRGRTLNVVAQELRAYARQTRTHALAVADRLRRVDAAAAEVATGGEEAGGARLSDIRAFLGDAVEQLRQCGGETAWVLSQIQEQSATVVAALEAVLDRFEAHALHRQAIAAALDDLAALSAAATEGVPGWEISLGKEHMLAFMEEHYTMESERAVHGCATGQGGAAAAEVDLDDVLF